MSNYAKTTDFAIKDGLATGNPAKVVKGTEFDTEFNNIATAISSKADTASPTFTGTVTAVTFSGALSGNASTATSATTAAFATNANFAASATNATNAGNAATAAGFSSAGWTVIVAGSPTSLFFSLSGTTLMKLDSSGNLWVHGSVNPSGV